jgi:hypothetical protein
VTDALGLTCPGSLPVLDLTCPGPLPALVYTGPDLLVRTLLTSPCGLRTRSSSPSVVPKTMTAHCAHLPPEGQRGNAALYAERCSGCDGRGAAPPLKDDGVLCGCSAAQDRKDCTHQRTARVCSVGGRWGTVSTRR